jgi:phosphatidylglycerol:prolipoprotein diacylglycerol transferase
MYALALSFSSLPFFHMGQLSDRIPIQTFGLIVAVGVLIGAALLRRYAEWHGISDDHIRGLLAWVTIAGFLGAHEFDMIAYNWDKIGDASVVTPASWWPGFLPSGLYPSNWPLPLKIWEGISSYGGFIGGAMGFAIYVWWKRLPVRLFADITLVGLLPAFSIGRIGCTVVSDHIGSAVDASKWYAGLAMDYPRHLNLGHLSEHYPGTGEYIKAWNLGLIELLYLIPVNALILWLAFRPGKRLNAGLITVIAGLVYAPVRFFLDFLRPEDSDPRHMGLTFAQWASILAFGVAVYVALRLMKNGKPAVPVTKTSGEAQAALKMVLREEMAKLSAGSKTDPKAKTETTAETKKPESKDDDEDEELAKEAEAAGKVQAKADAKAEAAAADEESDDEQEEEGEEEEAAPAAAAKPAGQKPKPGVQQRKSGGKKKRKR